MGRLFTISFSLNDRIRVIDHFEADSEKQARVMARAMYPAHKIEHVKGDPSDVLKALDLEASEALDTARGALDTARGALDVARGTLGAGAKTLKPKKLAKLIAKMEKALAGASAEYDFTVEAAGAVARAKTEKTKTARMVEARGGAAAAIIAGRLVNEILAEIEAAIK